MSMYIKGFFFSVLLCSSLTSYVFSQVGCEQTLNQATAEFDAGRFYSLPALLKNCLEKGFTKEQQFRAYYILVQAYLILDDPIAAEDSYLKLLRVDPEFKPNEQKDPIDLVYLSRKFTSRPRFTPHFRLGANVSFPHTISEVSTFSSNASYSLTPRVGFHFGAGIDWNINDRWSICTGGNFAFKSFSLTVSNIAKHDDLTFVDKSTWFDIPFYLKYSYDSGRVRPFFYAGFALNLLLSSSAALIFHDNSPSQGNTKIAQGPDLDIGNRRNFLNRSLLFGGGIKYKIGKNFIYADARYLIGLNNLTIPDKNYYNSDGILSTTLTQYQYVNDFFRLDNLSLTIGYIRPLYNPRKIKKVNSKGIFRNLFKPKGKKV